MHSQYARFDDKDFSQEHSGIKDHLFDTIQQNDTIVEIDSECVEKVLRKIKVRKSCGPDKLKGYLLKQCREGLVYIIRYISNWSLSSCTVPKLWKKSEIIPVQKKDFPKVHNDFRPVALTSILCKSFERIILDMIKPTVEPYLDNLQFVYQEKRSTDDALATLHNAITAHLDEGSQNYVRVLFIDYS